MKQNSTEITDYEQSRDSKSR